MAINIITSIIDITKVKGLASDTVLVFMDICLVPWVKFFLP